MNKKFATALAASTLCLSSVTALAAEQFDRKAYVDSVVTILRIHADTLQNLTAHKIKYSDNLVRHAIALEHTFGLLGPMDWHAAEAVKLASEDGAKMEPSVEEFERLQKRSRDALRNLVIAAHRAMEEDNREGVNQALHDMKESCNACHEYLPESAAPDVWGSLQR